MWYGSAPRVRDHAGDRQAEAEEKRRDERPMRFMLLSKIHRGKITGADLHYEGSIAIDTDLLEAADMIPGEQVHVLDIDNGERLITYIIPGERGSGEIAINGAAARKVSPGDRVIIITYGAMEDAEARRFRPTVIVLDENNHIKQVAHKSGSQPEC